MPVTVNLSTTLRRHVANYQPALGLTLEVGGGVSALGLAQRIGLPIGDIKVIMLNGRRVAPEAVVADGDRVGFFPAVGGG